MDCLYTLVKSKLVFCKVFAKVINRTFPSTNFLWKPGSHKTVTGKILGASSGHLQKLTDLSSIRLRNDCYITECGIFFMSFNPVVAQKECCRHRECCNDNCR